MTNLDTSVVHSLGTLLPLVMEAFNEETKEYNELVSQADSLEAKNHDLLLQVNLLNQKVEKLEGDNLALGEHLEKMVKGSEQVKANAEEHMRLLEQGNRRYSQMKDQFDQQAMILKGYKEIANSPKKIREQLKTYKDKVARHLKAEQAHKKDIREYRREIDLLKKANDELNLSLAQSNITTIWSKNGDHLMLFPTPLTMAVNGQEEKQMTLLFMNASGCGKLIGLTVDGEPILCKMPKAGLKPKAATIEHAGNVLRKLRKQKWRLHYDDLLSIKDM